MQGERQGENAFTVGGDERPARRRSFLSDTMQFMPQASTGINAEGAVTLLLASDACFLPKQRRLPGTGCQRMCPFLHDHLLLRLALLSINCSCGSSYVWKVRRQTEYSMWWRRCLLWRAPWLCWGCGR